MCAIYHNDNRCPEFFDSGHFCMRERRIPFVKKRREKNEYNNNDRNKRKIKGKNWSARCRADRYAVCNCDYFDAV